MRSALLLENTALHPNTCAIVARLMGQSPKNLQEAVRLLQPFAPPRTQPAENELIAAESTLSPLWSYAGMVEHYLGTGTCDHLLIFGGDLKSIARSIDHLRSVLGALDPKHIWLLSEKRSVDDEERAQISQLREYNYCYFPYAWPGAPPATEEELLPGLWYCSNMHREAKVHHCPYEHWGLYARVIRWAESCNPKGRVVVVSVQPDIEWQWITTKRALLSRPCDVDATGSATIPEVHACMKAFLRCLEEHDRFLTERRSTL